MSIPDSAFDRSRAHWGASEALMPHRYIIGEYPILVHDILRRCPIFWAIRAVESHTLRLDQSFVYLFVQVKLKHGSKFPSPLILRLMKNFALTFVRNLHRTTRTFEFVIELPLQLFPERWLVVTRKCL
jgi:hypothetical protein